jgi:hypothetical protein
MQTIQATLKKVLLVSKIKEKKQFCSQLYFFYFLTPRVRDVRESR